MNLRPLLLSLTVLLLVTGTARAAGPKEVAVADRSLWPTPIRSPKDFDQASRAENLVFAKVLGELEARSGTEAFPAELGVKQVHTESLRRWLGEVKGTVAANLRAARASCGAKTEVGCAGAEPSAENVVQLGTEFFALAGPQYQDWKAMADRFYGLYVKELMRLAALFPAPTSEILTLGPGEFTGSEWPDRQFLLTFDDGPTPAGGGTDKLMALLTARKASGVFFVLGDALKNRLDKTGPDALKVLYQGQCVGSHGQEHKSHQKLATWKDSLENSRGLVGSLGIEGNNKKVLFRPPYGQRTEELTKFLQGQGASVVLWNIDSQDWNASVAPGPTTDRVISLMLLWRRGVVLFHDVHNKVHQAVPRLLDFADTAGLQWKNCKTL
ncbi:polysaccharide deacetylase family protein [Archangium sp.]|uniref:polysaccharide deacetylase family protein n=1 Tax=Archangium sp. TaxID=1872627 RepID=UPI002D56CCBD|nr:polysaccharide deacetylase family protein [Archangium sp.]HYO59893.1 polysaccharide deacetylase family protein [Archangium sp.]